MISNELNASITGVRERGRGVACGGESGSAGEGQRGPLHHAFWSGIFTAATTTQTQPPHSAIHPPAPHTSFTESSMEAGNLLRGNPSTLTYPHTIPTHTHLCSLRTRARIRTQLTSRDPHAAPRRDARWYAAEILHPRRASCPSQRGCSRG